MGNYTIIAEVGNALVRLLQKELVPDIVSSSAGIGLASPADRGDKILCIHLYDVSESRNYRVSGMVSDGVDRQKFPPIHLTLSYMVTAFSASDVKYRSQDEQRILGKVVQVLRDNPILNLDTMEFGTGSEGDRIRIEMIKPNAEEKTNIWPFSNTPSKLSLFYRMEPVALESAKTKNIRRVQEIEFRKEVSGKPWAKLFRRNHS